MTRHLSERGQPLEPAILILASFAGGPKHGYAVIEDIARFTGLRLKLGTLYQALVRLEGRGLIRPLPKEERRHPYQLTDLGREMLTEQLAAMQDLVHAGLDRLARG